MKTVLDVVDYLQSKGFKCGKSAVYNHVNAGLLVKRDGEYQEKDIDRYAGLYLKRENGGTSMDADHVEELQKNKLAADARKAQAQAEHWEMKTKIETGQYIDKDLFFGEMAARAAILKNDLESFIRSGAGAMIKLSDGDQIKIPDVIDYWLEKLEIFLGRYSEEKVWDTQGKALTDDDD